MTAPPPSDVPPTSTADMSATAVELKDYRTEELAEHVADLLSLPQAMARLIQTIALVALLLLVLTKLNLNQGLVSIYSIAALAYALIAGLAAGLLLGFLRVAINASLRFGSICELTLELTQRAAHDIRGLSAGQRQLPATRELTAEVYQRVISPILYQVARKNLSLLGWPVGRALQGMGRMVVGRMSQAESSHELTVDLPANDAGQDLPAVPDNRIDEFENQVQQDVARYRKAAQGVAQFLNRWLILPIGVGISLLVTLLLLPLYWLV